MLKYSWSLRKIVFEGRVTVCCYHWKALIPFYSNPLLKNVVFYITPPILPIATIKVIKNEIV